MLFVDRGFSIDIIFGFIIWNGRQIESVADAQMTERERESKKSRTMKKEA